MTIKTTFYFFPNDVFRAKGLRISILDMEELGKSTGTEITLRLDKAGAPGAFSKVFLKGILVDEIWVTVEGESEEAIRKAIRAIYEKFSPYETSRGRDGDLAKKFLKGFKA